MQQQELNLWRIIT